MVAEGPDGWGEARRQREERMRYEVLDMIHRVSAGDTGRLIHCAAFAQDLGVWREEVYRVIDFLDRAGYLRYRGAGPVVCITRGGVERLASDSGARRIPDRP